MAVRVEQPDPRPRRASAWPRGLAPWVAILLLLAAAAGLHVHAKLATVQLGYSLSQAARANRELKVAQRELSVEAATLRSPRRLRRLAIEQLGLVERNPRQVIHLAPAEPRKLALGQPSH
jgi:cell division protein FtsL